MLSIILPLPILGFVIFLMVDSQKRFEDLQNKDPEQADDYKRQHALLMTLLAILIIVLLAAMGYGYYEHKDWIMQNFGWNKGQASFSNPLFGADATVEGGSATGGATKGG
jgi:hypothetical protein